VDVGDVVARWAYGTNELPIADLLEPFGLELSHEPQQSAPSLGARGVTVGTETRIAAVALGGAAHAAGLSAGDVLVAVDGLRVPPGKLATLLARYRVGDEVEVTVFRADVLTTRRVVLEATARTTRIGPAEKVGKRAAALRQGWLGGAVPG
jgi:predicted metalloprotease with PDZ domain